MCDTQQCCTCMVTKEWAERVQLLLRMVEKGWKEINILHQEHCLLDKLLRKNRNQHRSTRFYKKLEHVHRLLKKLWFSRQQVRGISDEVPLIDGSDALIPFVITSVLKNACRSVSSLHERRVPTVAWGADILADLFDQIRLAKKIIVACYEASRQCAAQLAHSFFMPLSVACLAVSSRIQTLMTSFLQKACRDYTTFVEIVQILPMVVSKESSYKNGVLELPGQMFCSIAHGKIPSFKMDMESTVDSMLTHQDGRDLLGMYPLEDSAKTAEIKDCCVVVEDHGEPVSREEVYAAMLDVGQSTATGVIPAFDTSHIPTLENMGNVHRPLYKNKKEVEVLAQTSEKELPSKVRITESVPPLTKHATAFIRVGDTVTPSVAKRSKKQPEPESLKSWEDWITGDNGHVQLQNKNQKQKKRRKR